jgi:hypothetical protein
MLENKLSAIPPDLMAGLSPHFNRVGTSSNDTLHNNRVQFDLFSMVTEVNVQNVAISRHVSLLFELEMF